MEFVTFLLTVIAAVAGVIAAIAGVIAVMGLQFPRFRDETLNFSRGYAYVTFRIETSLPGVKVTSLRAMDFDVTPLPPINDPLYGWDKYNRTFHDKLTNVIDSGLQGESKPFVLVLRNKDGSYPIGITNPITIEMDVKWRWFKWSKQTVIKP